MTMTAVVYAVGSYSFGGATMAQGSSAGAAKNVVLVHGAFADDSSWSKIGEISQPFAKPAGLDQLQPQPDGATPIQTKNPSQPRGPRSPSWTPETTKEENEI
jgi:hypothetical protein